MAGRTSFVWVEQLDIRGYKRLQGEYEFDERLSIIHGFNEAGKSSMHDAIVRALFGFSRSERRRYAGESEVDRCQPWNGNSYAINATVSTDDGRLRLEWDFSTHEVAVRNLDSGDDLSAQMRGNHGDVVLGPQLLGLSLEDFRQACCIDQKEISAVASSETLVVAMQRSVELGTTESGVEAADALLRGALSSDIGVRVDNLQPTRNGRLRSLVDRRDELGGELSRAETTEQEIADRERQLCDLESGRATLGQKTAQVAQAFLRINEEALARRLRRAREHQERATVRASEGAGISESDQLAITSRQGELTRLEGDLAEQGTQAEAASSAVQRLEGRRRELQTEFDGLAAYTEVDTSRQAAVQGLVARREDLVVASQAPAPADADEAPGPSTSNRSQPGWVAAALIAAASVLAGALITPIALMGLLVAGAVGYIAIQRGTAGPSATALTLELATRQRDEAAARLLELDRELAETLDAARAGTLTEIGERARAYLTACEKAERRTKLRAELGDLRAEIAAASEPIGESERIKRRMSDLENELAELYDRVGVDGSDPAAAANEFKQRLGAARERDRRSAAAEEAAAGLTTALGPLSMAELEAQYEAAVASTRAHVQENGELTVDFPLDALATRQAELQDKLGTIDIELADLRAQVRDREERLPDVPALREEADRLELEITELEESARAIAIAREALDQAAREAHRAFRPRLKAALDRNLARITDNRYQRVEIDDELNITVVAPETGRMVPAARLSRGTQDQIFYVERLEIIDLLDPTTGKAPLLVDEPFSHFDEERLAAALRLLEEETHERQVMLFTCDEDLVEAACRVCDNPAVIDLGTPS